MNLMKEGMIMKKTISLILLLALVVTIVSVAALSMDVFATENDSEKVIGFAVEASTSVVQAGEEFTVDITVTENTGFMYTKLQVGFPAEAVTAVAVDCSNGVFADVIDSNFIFIGESFVNIPIGTILDGTGMTDSCYDAVGLVGTITFRVNDGYENAIEIATQTGSNDIRDPEGKQNTMTVNNGSATINDSVGDCSCGDANEDGVVNYLDAMLIAQYYVGDIGEADLNLEAADVNADGVVNYLDAMMVAQFYVGDIDSFHTEN